MHKKCAGVALHIKFLDKLHNAMISNAILDLNSRKIALLANLFTITQPFRNHPHKSNPFAGTPRRSVVAQSAAAQLCGRGTSQKQAQKKNVLHPF